ncbi:MAG: hypothetical protein AB1792_07945 [Candidatus Zixiibacteriota bacterium]
MREDYRASAWLKSQDWDVGNQTAARLTIEYDDQEKGAPIVLGIRTRLNGTVGTDIAGGDFVYRKLSASLERVWPEFRIWGYWGAASGHVPVQQWFDAAVEGGVAGLPIRLIRTKGLGAGGVEGRLSLSYADFFLRPFASYAHADGCHRDLWELGIALTGDYMEWGFHADNWVLRIDLPFYSSGADDPGLSMRRAKWDLRRFRVRLNLPIEFAGQSENVSYRYPNR